jgi:putative transposase
MPRRSRSITPNIAVHVVQRGNNRRPCFCQHKDFRSYLAALGETSAQYGVAIHAFVLMTNHVHLLATPESKDSVSKMMQQLGRKYVSYFNKAHHRTGTLWEGRFKSSTVFSVRYLFACSRYIELNPVRAGLVQSPAKYEWSSYRANALGHCNDLVTPTREWLALGKSVDQRSVRYRTIFGDVVSEYDDQIRIALKKGRALR